MLTTIVERGRIKCHKYWPDVGDTIDYGLLAVTCITEDKRENFVFREFSIQHKENQEVRQVTQVSKLFVKDIVKNDFIWVLPFFRWRIYHGLTMEYRKVPPNLWSSSKQYVSVGKVVWNPQLSIVQQE